MSLPPKRLTIKRSRDDDPVDCLYLDQKQKRIRSNIVWQRLGSAQLIQNDAAVPSSNNVHGDTAAQAPTVKATLPGEENCDLHNGGSGLFQNIDKSGGFQIPDEAARDTKKTHKPVSSQARQFHLTKASFPSLSLAKAGNGVHKRNKKDKRNVAVLMEKKAEQFLQLKLCDQSTKSTDVSHNDQSNLPPEQITAAQIETPPLKRPRASAEEMKWRATTRDRLANFNNSTPSTPASKRGTNEQSSTFEDETLVLAEQLHDFALQFQPSMDRAPAGAVMPTSKFRPKPPPPRPQRQVSHEEGANVDAVMVEQDSTNDDEYTYDTYVRVKGPGQGVSPEEFPSQAIAQGLEWNQVGILVIEDKDESMWQEYLEDMEDEEDWDDEDEDENAEDYYANDYPEDELDSDDEYDRQAYGYRADASDDEEFDEDYVGCSDEELRRETTSGRAPTLG